MNVLSLFDGMSCGRIALDRAGIQVDNYYASEVDKYATKVSVANYPNIIHLGDVTKWREWDIDWGSIDLLIGGSPCQGFSFAGKQLAFDDPRSALFFEYLNILNHIRSINSDVKFMLENVRMKREYLEVITELLGVEPIFINSSLVSAQNRQRYYWANWDFEQPEDRGFVLADILESSPAAPTLMSAKFVARQQGRRCLIDASKSKAASLSAGEYVKSGRQGDYLACTVNGVAIHERRGVETLEGNAYALTASAGTGGKALEGCKFVGGIEAGRRLYDGKNLSRNFRQGSRVYHESGKSPTLPAAPVGNQAGHACLVGGVSDCDGLHYRKLTALECERLQTVQDNYTNHVSNTQRYKMLGNGWTVDVIAHIFSSLNNGI